MYTQGYLLIATLMENIMSIQTENLPTALGALSKAKRQNFHNDQYAVQKPAAVIVENQHTEVLATPAQDPTENEATLEQNLTPVENSDDGRNSKAYKELKQYHDKIIYEERKKFAKELEDERAKSARQAIKTPKTAEEMKKFKKEHPDTVDYLKSFIIEELQNDNTFSDLKDKMDSVNRIQAELREKEALNKLLAEHPDADEIRRDPKFLVWFNEQPESIRNILEGMDVKAISKQLTLYKFEVLGETPKSAKKVKTQEAVDASLAVSVRGHTEITPQKKIWTMAEINEIARDYKKYDKHRVEIDLARREGRVK